MHAVVSAGANAGPKKASADSTRCGAKRHATKKSFLFQEIVSGWPGYVAFPNSGSTRSTWLKSGECARALWQRRRNSTKVLFEIPYLISIHRWHLHDASTKELADRGELIMTPRQRIQEHVVPVSTLILRLPDRPDCIIVLLANSASPLHLAVFSDLHIQTSLMETMLAHKMHCWQCQR